MTKKKKSFLPTIEVLIIAVFFFSFIAWAMSQCKVTREEFQQDDAELANDESLEEYIDSTALAETVPAATNPQVTTPTATVTPAATASPMPGTTTSPAQSTATAAPPKKTKLAPLFITIDGLKLRTGPSLDSAVIAQLKLYEEVNFLNEVTDSTYQINLGYEIADEPWVKVQSRRGQIGWVYGAGVNYYKKKRSGVLE